MRDPPSVKRAGHAGISTGGEAVPPPISSGGAIPLRDLLPQTGRAVMCQSFQHVRGHGTVPFVVGCSRGWTAEVDGSFPAISGACGSASRVQVAPPRNVASTRWSAHHPHGSRHQRRGDRRTNKQPTASAPDATQRGGHVCRSVPAAQRTVRPVLTAGLLREPRSWDAAIWSAGEPLGISSGRDVNFSGKPIETSVVQSVIAGSVPGHEKGLEQCA